MTGKTTPLYVVCSPCRCVGTTLVSRLLTEFYVVDDRPVAAFDLADEGPQLSDYLPEFATIANIGDIRGQMALFDRLITEENTPRVIDVSRRAFKKFFTIAHEISFFEEARGRSIEPVILFIIDSSPESAKAYAILRRRFMETSFLPVRNQIEASSLAHCDLSPHEGKPPTSLDIPLLGFSLRALIERQSFSFSQFWRAAPAGLSDALDAKLRDWVEHIFLQIRDLELFLGCEDLSTYLTAQGLRRPRTTPRQGQRDTRRFGGDYRRNAGSAAMDHSDDQTGKAILAMLQKAADQSNDDCNRARTMANERSRRLRATEDRINQLETEIVHFRERTARAEKWLQLIQREIEEILIAPTTAARPNSMTIKG
jgi:hypothetical protein